MIDAPNSDYYDNLLNGRVKSLSRTLDVTKALVSASLSNYVEFFRLNTEDEKAQAFQISISPFQLDPAANGAGEGSTSDVMLVGRVEWGISNDILMAEFDIGRGVVFTVTGSSVRVLIGADFSTVNSPSLKTTAMISRSDGVRKNDVVRTIKTNPTGLAATATTHVNIPPFARRFKVLRSGNDNTAPAPAIAAIIGGGVGQNSISYLVGAGETSPWLDLPNVIGTNENDVELVNVDTIDATFIMLLFSLDL